MSKFSFYILSLLLLTIGACNSSEKNQNGNDTSSATNIAHNDTSHADMIIKDTATVADSTMGGPAVTIARNYLNNSLKEDLSKGLIDSSSRRFLVEEHDLNADGKNEVFIGLSGTYFCGSGGCTFILLNNDGSLNTRFTVSESPFLVCQERTKGWADLVIQSRGKSHLMKYKGSAYPGNPSVEPVVKKGTAKVEASLFDTTRKKYQWFTF